LFSIQIVSQWFMFHS